VSHYIDNILERSEHKKWEGKINRAVISTLLIIGIIVIVVISAFFFLKETISYTSSGAQKQISGSLIGSGILVIGLAILLLNFFSNFVVEYAVTNKRVIIKSGLIEEKKHLFSIRGKRVPYYTLSNKNIVISPKKLKKEKVYLLFLFSSFFLCSFFLCSHCNSPLFCPSELNPDI